MNFTDLALTRQSCRKYNPDKAVEDEKIAAIIEAANLAPTYLRRAQADEKPGIAT